MSLELRQLRALLAVVDEGTFTDAAISIGLSQASVSRSIVALERELGAQVLHRTTRQLSLTDVGARIIDHARRAVNEAEAIERAVQGPASELRVGYAWSVLGRHTTTVQQQWAASHGDAQLIFVQSNTATAGLGEGAADIAVLRRPLEDRRYRTALVGLEDRYAAVATGDPLARRRRLVLADFKDRTIAVDSRTGTTTDDLWSADAHPRGTREVHGVDEWLTVIAAGQAIGITSEATTRQHPRPGIVFRLLRDAPPVQVWLAWGREKPPAAVLELQQLISRAFAQAEE